MPEEFKSVFNTVLLGAEGYVEAEATGWVEDATEEDVAAFILLNDLTNAKFAELSIDHMNRPYTLVRVLDCASSAAIEKARTHSRVKRLED